MGKKFTHKTQVWIGSWFLSQGSDHFLVSEKKRDEWNFIELIEHKELFPQGFQTTFFMFYCLNEILYTQLLN